jgi:AbrB family looped-hinge helix DNA binding protein
MRSKITDKFQITLPKEVRELLKLNRGDILEWKMEGEGVSVEAVSKPFLRHRGTLRIGPGDIGRDISEARREIGLSAAAADD